MPRTGDARARFKDWGSLNVKKTLPSIVRGLGGEIYNWLCQNKHAGNLARRTSYPNAEQQCLVHSVSWQASPVTPPARRGPMNPGLIRSTPYANGVWMSLAVAAPLGLLCASSCRFIQVFFGFDEGAFHKLFGDFTIHGFVSVAIYLDSPRLFSLVSPKSNVEFLHKSSL